jgi:coproporphyrinogen III oxidase-like Fe-S oxidoreductase
MREIEVKTERLLKQKTTEDWTETDFPYFAYIHIPFCRRRCYY